MVGQYSNFFASFSLINLKTTLFSSMMPTRTQRNTSCQWLNFLRRRVLSLVANCINGNRLLSCMLLKNMQKKVEHVTCVGAQTIRWQINFQERSLKTQKAQICRLSFFYTFGGKCMMVEMNTLIIAFSDFTYNCLSESYV